MSEFRRVLDADPLTGITTYFDYNPVTDQTIIETSQDVAPILDWNKALQNDGTGGYRDKSREMRHAARIPLVVIEKWLREDGIDVFNADHWDAVKRKLNSSEYAYLRTAQFQI